MADLIDKIIEDAMRQGQFDNLPGKGQPLKLDQNPHEDPEKMLAYKLLHENDFTLPWIQERQEIESELDTALKALKRDYDDARRAAGVALAADSAWAAATTKFRAQVANLNKRVETYNLSVPSQMFQRLKFNPDQLIQSLISNP